MEKNNKKIEFKNILDVMYEPKKEKFSLIEFNSRRREITKTEFINLIQHYIKLSIKIE